MCRCLAVQPSGYYAWRKEPLSRRACEEARQTTLIRQAWDDSGKIYGYRKLHDDLLDQGETCCPNRVARLTKLAGIKAPTMCGDTDYGSAASGYDGRDRQHCDHANSLQSAPYCRSA